MLSDDNNSGLTTFMVGLIVVVMAGVGLSVLVDSRFSFSKGAKDLQSAIASDKEEIAHLSAMVNEFQSQFASQQPKLKTSQNELKQLESQIAEHQAKLNGLKTRKDEVAKSIQPLEEQFAAYRKRYREQIWAAAIGQSLGDLEVKGGRIYHHSVINRVTEVGLEIRHDDGIARIQGPELSPALQSRFQWDDAERTRRLEKELADHNSIKAPETTPKPPPKPAGRFDSRKSSPEQAKIEAARKKVSAWKTRVSQISSDRSTAQNNAYSAQTSVPGSLETWQARASRLTTELTKAKGELAAAKAELELLNPNDLLLRPDPTLESPADGF